MQVYTLPHPIYTIVQKGQINLWNQESEGWLVLLGGREWLGRVGRRFWMLQCSISFSGCLVIQESYLVTSHWALYLKVYKVCIKPPFLILWSLLWWPSIQIYTPMGSFLFKSLQEGSCLGLEYVRIQNHLTWQE